MNVDEATWKKMLTAFREYPGSITHASKTAGVSIPTARRAWVMGWPRNRQKPWAKEPIAKVLEEERFAARARREEMEQKAIADEAERALLAKMDAIQARADEASMAKVSRRNATNMGIMASKLVVLTDNLVNRLKVAVEDPNTVFTPKEIREWVRETSRTVQRVQNIMQIALQIERIFCTVASWYVWRSAAVSGATSPGTLPAPFHALSPAIVARRATSIARSISTRNMDDALTP